MTDPIRVVIVDDQPVVRSGLVAFLLAYDDLELVGEASDGDDARTLCARVRPDVVLMDLVMPRVDGVTAIRAVREISPETQIIALTSFRDDDLVRGALEAGAISYLLKNVQADALADAIRDANSGKSTLAPEATQALIHAVTQAPALGHDLTERERDVLALMVQGLNNTAIADRLVISRSTVKFHVSSILSKLGASSRTEAAALAVQHHLVD